MGRRSNAKEAVLVTTIFRDEGEALLDERPPRACRLRERRCGQSPGRSVAPATVFDAVTAADLR